MSVVCPTRAEGNKKKKRKKKEEEEEEKKQFESHKNQLVWRGLYSYKISMKKKNDNRINW